MAPIDAISQEIARRFRMLLKSAGGHGPRRARVFLNDEVITIVCEETLTTAEQTLHREELEAVVRSRRAIQRVIRDKFAPVIEEMTGMRVVASTSGHTIEPDIGIYNFVLDSPPDWS